MTTYLKLYIVDRQDQVVVLNDTKRTRMEFTVGEMIRAQRICDELNAHRPRSLRAPFRLIEK